MAVRTVVFACVIAVVIAPAQSPVTDSQKPAVIAALNNLERELRRLRVHHSGDRALLKTIDSASRSALWLRSEAARWRPAAAREGREMREAIDTLVKSISSVRSHKLPQLLTYAAADLEAKVEHCREHGLADRPVIRVVTKRGGIEEVHGLDVVYMAKILELDPAAEPKQFEGFSSPVSGKLVPGIYLFWARDAKDHAKAGRRREARVSRGEPVGPIEVLAP